MSRQPRPEITREQRRKRRQQIAAVIAAIGLALPAAGALHSAIAADREAEQRRSDQSVDNFVAQTDTESVADVVAATRNIGLQVLAAEPDATGVISPSSLVVALSMLADGASGETLAELENVLGAAGVDRLEAVAGLRAALAQFEGDPAVVQKDDLPETPLVHLASQLVVDDELAPNPDYLDLLQLAYGAGASSVDLASPAAKELLDDWVRQNTGGLIEQSAVQPNPALRLVLQDAALLAAAWESPFEPSWPGTFTNAAGVEEAAQLMAQAATLQYAEVDGWRAVRLPYRGGGLYADLVLPPKGVAPTAVTAEQLGQLDAALAAAEPTLVAVTVPKLELRPDPRDLTAAIRELGAGSILDQERADFSLIAPDISVSQAVQQVVFELNEQGTRAAAVTEIALAGAMPVQPIIFEANRPFLINVAQTDTEWPLFMAAVNSVE